VKRGHRWEDDIQGRIHLAQDRDQWQVLMNRVMNEICGSHSSEQ
jgi:hypothetical protein